MKPSSSTSARSRPIPQPIPAQSRFTRQRPMFSITVSTPRTVSALRMPATSTVALPIQPRMCWKSAWQPWKEGAALALASGAAAITYTIQALAANGGHIVAQKTIYGGSFNLLGSTPPQYGIETTFVDAHNLAEVEGAIRENTRAIYRKPWAIRTATFRISMPLRKSLISTAFLW